MEGDAYSFVSLSDSDVTDDSLSSVTGENEVKKIKQLAVAETRSIRLWRALILTLILVTGAAVSAITFNFLSDEYDNDGKESFTLFCNTIEVASQSHVRSLFEANRGLSHEITADALSMNQSFPFFTFDMFEVHAATAHQRASMEFIALAMHVEDEERIQWEKYSTRKQDWILKSREISAELNDRPQESESDNRTIPLFIQELEGTEFVRDPGPGPYAVTWQMSPTPASLDWINFNAYSSRDFPSASVASSTLKDLVFGSAKMHYGVEWDKVLSFEAHCNFHNQDCLDNEDLEEKSELLSLEPHVSTIQPIFGNLNPKKSGIVGWLWGVVSYDSFLRNLLPDGVGGIDVVLSNECGEVFTFKLNGGEVEFFSVGDQHDTRFDSFERIVTFTDNYDNPDLVTETKGHCIFVLHLYPTESFLADYNSDLPLIVSVSVASTFVVMAIAFVVFDAFVQRRNTKVVGAAARSQALVSSLFPSNIRDRLFVDNENGGGSSHVATNGTKSTLRNFLTGIPLDDQDLGEDGIILKSKPIADLFPETTIMFADISGFTAWSSIREPAQVFMLLETVYRAFDEIARKRRVYKVETIGDCYVAVCGLPDPRKDHAVVMARFARDCMNRMNALTRRLELLLGPDTGDLSMRMGLHSGPVTAGVLRGERSRFQLFGDTMNTAARMEHTGVKGRIQLSQETADLLIAAGKFSWVTPREDKVYAKGKGELQTQWLEVHDSRSDNCSVAGTDITRNDELFETDTRKASRQGAEKKARLIDWNVDILHRLLKQIVARRVASGKSTIPSKQSAPVWSPDLNAHTVLDEVKEIITLPEFNAKAAKQHEDPDGIEMGDNVFYQLKHYVSNVAAMYRSNAFHNFEHASHVTMSVVKLLSRIIAPSDIDYEDLLPNKKGMSAVASTLHDHTYGITSDPLTQFACVFSALIHDVDHPGVPNEQLEKEKSKIATFYKGKSVAEQNSVDLAWDLLMDERYADLRAAIYCDVTEMLRFRQLVVNAVMATDIVDKELKALRNARWEKAFDSLQDENPEDSRNRKATIVIEHLLQASDVAHTMQHWHVYRKWNERLFMECFKAYTNGRAEKNPADCWYEGEIAFFDFYIIPLAKKLKECGVFGVSSEEYLNYAVRNREEWDARGRDLVNEMVQKFCQQSFSTFNQSSTVSSTSTTPKLDSDDESDLPYPEGAFEESINEEELIALRGKVDAWNEKAKRSQLKRESSERTPREGVFFM